jgi:hypothetical protein
VSKDATKAIDLYSDDEAALTCPPVLVSILSILPVWTSPPKGRTVVKTGEEVVSAFARRSMFDCCLSVAVRLLPLLLALHRNASHDPETPVKESKPLCTFSSLELPISLRCPSPIRNEPCRR